ncbi:MAG: hypothetical protein ACHRHE_12365, partial [Tepidisphaerales bacterium]
MKLSRCLMVAVTGLWVLSTLGAAPATPPRSEANRTATSFFDETFPDKKPPFPRFKILPVAAGKQNRTGYDEARHGFYIAGYMSLIRPVEAGNHVRLRLEMGFKPLAKADSEPLTEFTFVLRSRAVMGVQIVRRWEDGKSTAIIRVYDQQEGEKEMTVY